MRVGSVCSLGTASSACGTRACPPAVAEVDSLSDRSIRILFGVSVSCLSKSGEVGEQEGWSGSGVRLCLRGAQFSLGMDAVFVNPMGDRLVGLQGEDAAAQPPPECSKMSLLSLRMCLCLGMLGLEVASKDFF